MAYINPQFIFAGCWYISGSNMKQVCIVEGKYYRPNTGKHVMNIYVAHREACMEKKCACRNSGHMMCDFERGPGTVLSDDKCSHSS